MSSQHVRLPLVFAALLALALAACPPAFAGEGEADAKDPTAVSQLEPEEIAFLEKKFPEWSELDPRRKEHIARNVLRLRGMSAAEREKLQTRIERLRKRGRSRSPGTHRGPRGIRDGAGIFRVADAVGTRVIERLPPAVRIEIAKLDVRPSMVKMTLFRMLKSKAAAEVGYEFSAEELEALPESMRRHVPQLIAQASDPDGGKRSEGARSKLSHLRLLRRMDALQKRLTSAAKGGRVSTEQFADAIVTTWSGAISATLAGIEANPKGFLRSIERADRGHMSRFDYVKSVWVLERYASDKWKDDPEARAAADRVVKRLLVDALHVDKAKVAALPGYESGRERRQAISKLVEGKGSSGKKGSAGKHRGRDGKRRGPPGKRKK